MDLGHQVAIITGSAQGLGKAFASRLLEAGVKVCISDINVEKGEEALTQLRQRFGLDKVHFVGCDVTSDEQFKKLFDKAEELFEVDCVDIFVNNAGVNTSVGWKKCMEVNIMAVLRGAEIAVERMKNAGKQGQIINTASLAAFSPGLNASMVPYTVSKHGVVAMTRTLATDNSSGIMHKVICPAYVDTEIVSTATTDPIRRQAMNATIEKLGGLMTPEFVAKGFYELVTQCPNGSCMVIFKDTPYFLMPDFNKPVVLLFAVISKLIGNVIDPTIVSTNLLLLTLTMLMIGSCLIMKMIFNFL